MHARMHAYMGTHILSHTHMQAFMHVYIMHKEEQEWKKQINFKENKK